MTGKRLRLIAVLLISAAFLLAWIFPIFWSLLNSLKTERDVLAYPPKLFFQPTLDAYRDVLFGSASIVPNLVSSFIISIGTTVITMVMAVPAAYALARLRFRGKKFAGFYVLATQMLPPVGIIIPYFLILRNIGWIDTYQGIILIYLSFSLPFAIWLLVSYFEDIPYEMEEAAYLDGASRMRTLWRIIIPQVRGGIAVTIVFVFLGCDVRPRSQTLPFSRARLASLIRFSAAGRGFAADRNSDTCRKARVQENAISLQRPFAQALAAGLQGHMSIGNG